MLQACAIYAVVFKSVSCPPKTVAEIKNCFEFAATNLKFVSNPKEKQNVKMCPTKNCNRNKNGFDFVIMNLKTVSNPKAKTKRKNVSAENCYK